ncbi:MAG: FtsW/RodA/SpoVE family cell cycle protein, partial [Pseudomonadales bacterium]
MANPISARQIATPVRSWPVDPVIAVTFLSLMLTGLVMVASASTEISAQMYGSPFYMLIKHGVYMGVALAAGAAMLMVPVRFWQRLDWLLLLVSFALLIAVLVPGIGKEVNGSTRWISFGAFSLQGSEFIKLFVLVYIAGYLVRHKEEIATRLSSFIKPLVLVMALVALLLQQPDFGAAVVIMAAVMSVIFLAGVPLRHFLPIVTLALVTTVVIAVWQPYRLERLTVFANPWEHQYGGGYQLTQALIAIG